MTDRKQEQAELIFMLGTLLGPLLRMTENADQYDLSERARIFARFSYDRPTFQKQLIDFTQSEPGHKYLIELERALPIIDNLELKLQPFAHDNAILSAELQKRYQALMDVIISIPVPSTSVILEAHTPFSTYCFIKDHCITVTNRLTWVDRYMDASLFYRFLRDVPSRVVISLVTWPASKMVSKKDKDRYAEFIEFSKLFAAERGPAFYSLIATEDIHDRWLCCDDRIYSLGGSVKDAGLFDNFTLSNVESSTANFDRIHKLETRGNVLFGQSQTTHLS